MTLAKRLANRAQDLLYLPGSGRFWARRLRGRALCLLYHRVDDPCLHPWLARRGPPVIAPQVLAQELHFWQRLGARFGTFRDLREGWFPGASEVGIIVCFDDGFRDNYTHGLEVLTRLGLPATIFQVSGIVGAAELNWEHAIAFHQRDPERAATFRRLAEEAVAKDLDEARDGLRLDDVLRFALSGGAIDRLLARAEGELGGAAESAEIAHALYPDAGDLRRAAAAGVEIASHGEAHQPRTRLDDRAFEHDLCTSRARLAELVGEAPDAYSYPFGRFRPGDEAICRRHYRQAAIVKPEPIERGTSAWSLPRASWPGPARNGLRRRRWLLTGRI